MPIKHRFTSPIADGADATLVRPSNWNDDHDATDVTISEGGTPAVPDAGKQTVFIDSADHKMKLRDSAGVVTAVGTGTGSAASTAAALITAFNTFR